MNYGALGFTAGNQLSHTFYMNKRVFDHEKNKTDCIVKQYEKYLPIGSTQVSVN